MAARLKVKNDVKDRSGNGNGAGRVSTATKARVLYLYGVAQLAAGKSGNSKTKKNFGPEKTVAVAGIDGASAVKGVECAGVLAWMSEVDAQEFAADLASKMEDMEWLSDASVRHQRVVGAIAEKMELLPARFGTVFLGMESLEADIRSRKKQLAAAFARIADADEWGVKVFMTAASVPVMQKATSGKNYLQIKARAIEAKAKPVPDKEIDELDAALAKIARASTVTGKVSGGLKGLQWQATFLVPRSRRKQWDATLKKFAARWDESRRIECTGPWPPYSFVEDNAASAKQGD